MILIQIPPDAPMIPAKVVHIRADRHTLAKRRWRATADDKTDFGFDLSQPLSDGMFVFFNGDTGYCIEQTPESVLEIPLPPDSGAAASVGWMIGNLHFSLEPGPDFVRVADDPALEQMLHREAIPFRRTQAVFQPLTNQAPHTHGH